MKIVRGILKVAIALFVLWHMGATFVYSLYHVEGVPVLEWLNNNRRYTRPYVLTTSQWQRWNLFSPDPLRRVIEMRFVAYLDGEWKTVRTLNEKNVSWWQRAPELKIMRRMEDENLGPLRERYMHDMCRYMNFPPGTPMQMFKKWQVIPKNETTQSIDWWRNWQPQWKEYLLTETRCPSTT